ncbi:MAG: hypothetical protein F6J90_24460 [Moorea sp. SIOASIH]|nr:hypothetical protein [Moorena sp. SIOASIH]
MLEKVLMAGFIFFTYLSLVTVTYSQLNLYFFVNYCPLFPVPCSLK